MLASSAIRAGVLASAGWIAAASPAAASYWSSWSDDYPVYSEQPYRRAPLPAPAAKHHPRLRPHTDEKAEKAIQQQAAKPVGPLVISVSIDQQKVRVFDANGLFAESPVSTGMRGHSTPMGVFSVIQKHKWHRSNIYSGAPMPYMQRITWSGIAMHAGVLPGYPASHGCIRMPNAFAIKMWGWTRMGARVIVAPGETAPEYFSHPLLITRRLAPSEPLASDQPKPVTSSKSDKAAALDRNTTLAAGELRASLALDDRDATPAELRAKVRTAEAGAATSGPATALADSLKTDKPAAASTNADTTTQDKPQDAPAGEAKASAESTAPTADTKSTENDRDSTGAVTAEATKPESTATPPAAEAAKTNESKTADAKPAEAKSEAASAAPATDASDAAVQDKDQSRAGADATKPPLPAVDPKVQIAAFVSGKDRKLYVRQNMKALFDVPVTVAPGDRPLGTHVFTAEVDKDGQVRWTVATLPSSRRAEAAEAPKSHRHKALAVEAKPNPAVDTPTQALDRLTIPQEAMTRLAQAISTGGSLIVSDQAIAAGETGEGTDFIVRLR
ncbi:L,D-transpeptidase family protein [Rhodopseudomonas sp. B29]|uniref:L,D-transpeptidase family protein n=1 Tax=Rhodopseudomonas sp. B29 TaxID=95607 RepID=UPI00034DAB0B|nr:L,D-transpeptidase family protein [Rhodopseudomonas sp. B29]